VSGPVDTSVSYLGLRLDHPFMLGASPLVDDLGAVRRLEDAGTAAIVFHSIFEEQITEATSGRIRHLNPFDEQFATTLSYFPPPNQYYLGPEEYLEQIRRAKEAVALPIIGSLNGTTAEAWLTFARRIEQAGADALEVNLYEVVTGLRQSSAGVERDVCTVVVELKRALRIPVAIKLSPFFTALAPFARELDAAGADGLVLFNRFYQPDFDIERLSVVPRLELSDSRELLLRLRWLAILHGRVKASLAATGGVAAPADGIKAVLAGAHAVQIVSAVLRQGPGIFAVMRDGLRSWMEAHQYESVNRMRGLLSLAQSPDPSAFERAQYIRTLSSLKQNG
jgi:dihydroorotate dehydrogenase (fumarate)